MIAFLSETRSISPRKRLRGLGFSLLLFLLPAMGFAQKQKFTLNGFIRDAASGENLIGVAIFDPKTGDGTTTNNYGFYSLTVPQDSLNLVISYIGYDRLSFKTFLNKNLEQNFTLKPANELQTVEVVGSHQEKIRESTRMSTVSVPVAQIKTLPALFGEVDVLKTLQLLPGVQSGGEGSTGLYVRGGSPDQNLILLDGAPVYNASHLFGFFSVFNADALNNVELVKGGFPARYGGRLSSVLEMTMKEGNLNEFHGEGSVGIIAAKATVEAPIIKDTSSFILSVRRTYIDALTKPFMNKETGIGGYYFYDLNAKVNYKLSQRDRLYLSLYTGYDKFSFEFGDANTDNEFNLGWGNLTSALRWNRIVNNRLFANTHFTYTKYQFDIRALSAFNGQPSSMHNYSNIRDLSLKTDFDYTPNPDHYIRFGAQYTVHSFKPAAVQRKNSAMPESDFTSVAQTLAGEGALYVEDDYRITDRLKANAGLRLGTFAVDKKLYASLEPRLSARYLLGEQWSLKTSYARTAQFIHLLTNSGIGLPTDLWVPATAKVKPQFADQIAAGAARNLFGDAAELSVEAYYKKLNRIIEYREGANFLGSTDTNWEKKVTAGQGWSYGVEFFLQKKTGRATGWIGYTVAWANRQFEELNAGEIFPYKYDRRHDVSVVLSYQLNPEITLSGTWVYGTGNAVTLPESRYFIGNYNTIEDYGSRNKFRMEPYHRLDLALNQTRKKRWGEVVNSFGLYNAYSRRNPYFILFVEGYETATSPRQPSFRQVSLFPIIPSFTKSFKF